MSDVPDIHLEWAFRNAVAHGGKFTYSELAGFFGFDASYRIRNRLRNYAERRQSMKKLPKPEPPPGFVDPKPNEPNPMQARFTEQGNYAEASVIGPQIKTLDELIEACSIDLNVWDPLQPEFKTWDGWAKKERADLVWSEGKIIEGYVKKQGLETITLYSVSCRFVRKDPIEVRPMIKAVTAQVPAPEPPEPQVAEGRSIVIADAHIGFARESMKTMRLVPLHDRRVLDLALQIAQVARVSRVDFLGDLNDWTDTTDHFVRSPEYQFLTQPAVYEAHYHLSRFRSAFPGAKITCHEGNHEVRWVDAIVKRMAWAYDLKSADAPEGPGLLTIQKALGLDSLGIEWIGGYPDDDDWINEAVVLRHGPKARAPGRTAKAMAWDSDAVEIFGHIHRREVQGRTMFYRDGPRTIEAVCPGCTCHIDGRVPGKTTKQQWQQGLLILDFDGTVDYGYSLIPIRDGVAFFDGKRFEARPVVPGLNDAFPGWAWGDEV